MSNMAYLWFSSSRKEPSITYIAPCKASGIHSNVPKRQIPQFRDSFSFKIPNLNAMLNRLLTDRILLLPQLSSVLSFYILASHSTVSPDICTPSYENLVACWLDFSNHRSSWVLIRHNFGHSSGSFLLQQQPLFRLHPGCLGLWVFLGF